MIVFLYFHLNNANLKIFNNKSQKVAMPKLYFLIHQLALDPKMYPWITYEHADEKPVYRNVALSIRHRFPWLR